MFLDEPKTVLVAANVGVFNTNIFISTLASVPPPPAPGPFLSLVGTGGVPLPTHNSLLLPAYVDASLQLFCCGISSVAVDAMLMASLAALYPIRNQLVAGVWWMSVKALQALPIDLGVDDDGRISMSLNFVIRRRFNAALSS